MNDYESVILFRQALSEADVDKFLDKYKAVIEGKGGSIQKTDHWGRKRMAYEIEGERKAVYVVFLFQAPGETVEELERICRLDDGVLRHMAIRLTKQDLVQREKSGKEPGQGEESSGAEALEEPAGAGKESWGRRGAPRRGGEEND